MRTTRLENAMNARLAGVALVGTMAAGLAVTAAAPTPKTPR
jgi:hypothetical protein